MNTNLDIQTFKDRLIQNKQLIGKSMALNNYIYVPASIKVHKSSQDISLYEIENLNSRVFKPNPKISRNCLEIA